MSPAKTILALFGMLACLAAFSVQAKEPPGDPGHGKELYESICSRCHSHDANGMGPMHRGVYGRKAGSVAGYDYSAALKHSDIVWNATTLNEWLSGPDKLVPGTKMNIHVDNPRDRADIIAYLKSLH